MEVPKTLSLRKKGEAIKATKVKVPAKSTMHPFQTQARKMTENQISELKTWID
jgi:hypothetical protein